MFDGKKIPTEGRLKYRGIDTEDIVEGFQKDNRHGFEEISYLLLFGELPNAEALKKFTEMLGYYRALPEGFTRDMILKAPSKNIMNKLARSVLAFYSYDENPDDTSIENVLRQSIELIARFPTMAAYGYQAMQYYHNNNSLHLHKPDPNLDTAENLLLMIRPDGKYTKTEADVLDLALVMHAEHGGGNNSAFTVRVVSSSGTDSYSAIAAAVGSLKGPKHGGANIKVLEMMGNIKEHISDWSDESEIEWYLKKIVQKEAFDKSGLVYGLGHAVYTVSDPRSVLLKKKAVDLAKEKGRMDEFNLYCLIEKIAPGIVGNAKNSDKPLCINVDFYSGFVYDMLNIPRDLCTPLFAISRISGWCAHRIEELVTVNQIIRPAYRSVVSPQNYVPLVERQPLDFAPQPIISREEKSGIFSRITKKEDLFAY
jgi:citrate synthase